MTDIDTTPGEIVLAPPSRPMVVETSILSDDEIGRVWRISKSLAASGMFKDVTQAEQAFGRILLGRDLGLSPTQSLMGLDVVKGNVQMRGVLLLSFVRKHAEYDYRVTEHTQEAATIEILRIDPQTREWVLAGSERFTVEDAKRAKIYKVDGAWGAHPGNMCLWRAASNAVKFFAPDLLGGIPVYTEADSFDDRAIGAGEGDGSEPGWSGLSVTQVTAIEGMLERAAELGHAGLSDRATVQMRLAGQTPAYVDSWLQGAAAELAKLAETPVATAEEEPAEPVVSGSVEAAAQRAEDRAELDEDGAS